MRKSLFFLPIVCLIGFSSCNNSETGEEHEVESLENEMEGDYESANETNETTSIEVSDTYERNGLKVYPKSESVQFENATLKLVEPKEGAKLNSQEVNFKFDVQNYELGKVTSDAEGNGIANSDHGQHIHLILNNEPYLAHYHKSFSHTVEEAGNQVVIAFLSRSYHESVKSKDAYKVFQFSTGDAGNVEKMDLNQPLLFYSRPKGEYKGKDTQKIMFDFYLHNTELSENGNMVKLNINGEEDFYFAEWKPFIVEGLPMGENTFTIELVDAEGNLVGPEFNRISRTFTLSE